MLDAALAYGVRGWAIVPLEAGKKKPHIRTGVDHAEAATCDLGQIRAWWSRWPDAAIGIVCAAGGLVVIDVDGDEGRQAFLEHPGPFPLSVLATSGRETGGFHIYYRLPPGLTVPRGRLLAPGLELKGAGNLVVAPPSLHKSGRRYAWDIGPDRLMVQAPPEWMLADPRAATEPTEIPPAPSLTGAVATRYGAKALREELDRLANAPVGTRNDTLFRVARRLADLADAGHLDRADARRRVVLAAEHAYGGADGHERAATIRSAFREVPA